MIIAGAAKQLVAAVHTAAGVQVATGTIYCVARLEQAGNADDGKYWDTNAGGSWQASPVSWPTATHTQAGQWAYTLPAAATTGRAGATIHYTATDNLTEASATTVCGGGEHRVEAEDALTTVDFAALVDAVWDEALTGSAHNGATSAGRRLRQLGDVLAATVNDAVPTASAFVTTLDSSVDDWYQDTLIRFTSGALSGLTRIVANYVGATKTVQLDEPLPQAPANADAFDLIPGHSHRIGSIADAVWDEALADHLTAGTTGAALTAVSPPSGSSMVTLTIETDALVPVPVPGVAVAIYDATNTALQVTGTTDPSGQLVAALDDATYQVRLRKAGYAFTVPEALVVSGATTATLTATAWAPSAPSAVDLCVVYGWLVAPDGTVLAGAQVKAFARTPIAVGGYQLSTAAVEATTDETGYFELELVKTAPVRVICAAAGLKSDLTVPNAASQDLATWS